MTLRLSAEEYKKLQAKTMGRLQSGGSPPYSKYRNKKVKINGRRFDSMAEGNYYIELLQLRKLGVVTHFLRQVPIELSEHTSDKYRLDFLVFYADGKIDYVDVKGVETKEFKLKKSLIEGLYPFKIKLVKSQSITNHLKKLVPDGGGDYYYH